MAKPELEKDEKGEAIQGALTPETAHQVSLSDATARNTTAFAYRVIRVISSVNCFIKMGDSSVEAALTDHYLPAGAIEYFVRKEHTHLAAILTSGTGTLYISEMK